MGERNWEKRGFTSGRLAFSVLVRQPVVHERCLSVHAFRSLQNYGFLLFSSYFIYSFPLEFILISSSFLPLLFPLSRPVSQKLNIQPPKKQFGIIQNLATFRHSKEDIQMRIEKKKIFCSSELTSSEFFRFNLSSSFLLSLMYFVFFRHLKNLSPMSVSPKIDFRDPVSKLLASLVDPSHVRKTATVEEKDLKRV